MLVASLSNQDKNRKSSCWINALLVFILVFILLPPASLAQGLSPESQLTIFSKGSQDCPLKKKCGLSFNGTDQWVDLEQFHGFDTPSFTIETWFRWSGSGSPIPEDGTNLAGGIPFITFSGDNAEFDKDANLFFGIQASSGRLMGGFKEEPSISDIAAQEHVIFGNTIIASEDWHHAAMTYDGQTWKLFLDGELDAILTFPEPTMPQVIGPQNAYLAAWLPRANGSKAFYQGSLDEVRLWETARSYEEIQTIINLEKVSDSNLIGHWNMNERSGLVVKDSSGDNIQGKGVNNPSWTNGAPFNLPVIEAEKLLTSASLSAAANVAPDSPSLISPGNGEANVSTSPTLNVSVSDPESNDLTVTFYGKKATGTQGADFTLIALPDTQKYPKNTLGIFGIQTQWIVDQRLAQNISFVTHLGDMVDDWNVTSQWNVANAAMSKLEPYGIPYGIAPGNCDEDHYGVPPDTIFFNTYFPASRFAGRSYYGGTYNGDNANSYQLFSAGGMDFIVVHLKYNLNTVPDLSLAVLNWANDLLHANSNRRAIVVTHSLLTTSNIFSTDGSQIYNKLKENPNLFLMLGGHLDTEGKRQDLGSDGHTIYSLRSDYQTRANGGNGWLRLLRFSPSANKIFVTTYSPYLNQYETDADSQFSLDYEMNGSGFELIGTTSIPSGSNASMTWSGLIANTQYEWYTTVNDGTETTTGPTWNFNTGEDTGESPVITAQPVSLTVNAGQTAVLSAAASGTPAPSVQWQVSINGSIWNDIPGVTSTTYSFTAQSTDNGKQFRAVFTNSAGSTTSDIASLTVNSAPLVTTQPVSQMVNAGQSVAFNAAASGFPTPSIQWQISIDGSTWSNINGATLGTYSFTTQPADDGKQFHAVFTNVAGTTVSNPATLSISAPVNSEPNLPTLISPSNGAVAVATSTTLKVSVSDPESDYLTVTYYGGSSSVTPGPDFTVAVLPDTQKYTVNGTGIFNLQTQWLADQRSAQNIVYVSHLGGMVDDWNVPSQWNIANAAMSLLEPAVIPYGIGVGNTDEDHYGIPPDTTYFNTYFPASRFAGRSYYGGAYNGDNANSYQLFSAGGIDFIVINLKYNLSYSAEQSDGILTWADTLLKTNSNRRAIVVTHNLLTTSNIFSTDGSQIYNKLKENPNLFLMLGGHLDTEGKRQDLGSDGHTIYSLRSDYQTRANGGNGWLRLLRFSPSANKIFVTTYSPYLNQYETDADSQFSLDYEMNADNYQVIGTTSVPSSSNASVEWSNLPGSTSHEWYVTVSDGILTTTGPTWNFTTGSGATAPLITSQPVDQTVNASQTATFSAAASGAPTPAIQWQVSTDGSNWSELAGATSSIYSLVSQATDNGKKFRAVFTNSEGSATSDAATLTVHTAPWVTTQPANQVVNESQVVTFNAAASGTPTPAVQWQVSTDGSVWNNIANALSTTLAFTAQYLDNGKYFRAIFTNATGSVTSNTVTLTVNTLPIVVTQPVSQTVNAGDIAAFSATASGFPTPTVQWQASSDGSTWNNIVGATSGIYSLTTQSPDNGKQFRAVFTNAAGSASTNAATLTVHYAPVITIQPMSQSVAIGQTITFTAAASANPTPTVRWQLSLDSGTSWGDISGATSSTYSFTAQPTDNNKKFRAVFTNTVTAVTTNPATLTVITAPPQISSQPVSQTVIAGQPASFTASASGSPAPVIQWQMSTDGGSTWGDIASASTATYTLITQSADNGKQFRAVFTNVAGAVTSNAAVLNVNYAAVITVQPVSQSVTAGQTASFTASASGNPIPAVQWQVSINNGGSWNNIAGATSTTYTITTQATDNGKQFRAIFSNSVGSVVTNAAVLTVYTVPTVTTQPVSRTITEGLTATFSAAGSGNPTPTIQWQVSTDGATWANIVGATSTTYSFSARLTDNGRRFRAVFTNSVGSVGTNIATLTVIGDLIFKDGFTSCNAAAWTGGTVNSARLAFNTASGRNSTCGMAVTIAGGSAAYVIDTLPNTEARLRARFYFNPNTLKMDRNASHTIYAAYTSTSKSVAVIQIRYSSSVFQLRSGILSDANSWSYTSWTTISKAWHSIELDWRASTTTVANNGGLTFWIDGVQKGSFTTINNDQHKIDKVALGTVLGMSSTMSGTYFFDDYESRRQNYIGP